MMGPEWRRAWAACVVTTFFFVASEASAYTNWDDPSTTEADWCATCHGAFNPPGGGDLHAMHTGQISDCTVCHTTIGDNPLLASSGVDAYDTAPGDGCAGCHGRVDPSSGESHAYGLRAFHAGMGITVCADCHTTDGTPEPENVNPLNYGGTLTTVVSACNEAGTEDWDDDGTGLDNDGDGLYDLDDPDCAAMPDAGPPDAGPPDAGPPDAGPPDAGPADAGPADAGPADAGTLDAGLADAGLDGGGVMDAGGEIDAGVEPDAGAELDAGVSPDAGEEPSGGGDDGCGCAAPGAGGGTGSAVVVALGLALLLVRTRRRRRR